MIRTLYTLTMVALLGGSAWTATGMPTRAQSVSAGAGIVILAALQR